MARKARSHRQMVLLNALPIGLIAKIASILVHIEEGSEAGGHEFDLITARSMLADTEVQEFIEAARRAGFVPVKRSER